MKSFAIALCAPSGAGKTTVAQALVQAEQGLRFSVSVTTRPIRPHEREGVDYHYVTRPQFETMIREDGLVEWAEVHGDLYGTPRANLQAAQRDGKLLLLDIDVQGARQLVNAQPRAVTIFLLPPSFDVLMDRLRERGSEDESRLLRRLETAKSELRCVSEFQYVVINDRLQETVQRIQTIIAAERLRLDRRAAEIEDLRRLLQKGLEEATP